jgi:hypothetical protein
MTDVYVVTMRSKEGMVESVSFIGDTTKQVLYSALEFYPDYQVVRVNKAQQWDLAD